MNDVREVDGDNDAENCFDSGRLISTVSTTCLRVFGAAYFASLHLPQDRSAFRELVNRYPLTGVANPRFAPFLSTVAVAAPFRSMILPQTTTTTTTTTSVLFGSPGSVVRYQRCVSAFIMSLLVYFPLAQRLHQPLRPSRSTTATKTPPEATAARIALPSPPPPSSSFILSFFPVAAIAAHATWNAIAWSPPARLLDAVGATALARGPGAIGIDRWVAAAAAFEASAYASRWLVAALVRTFHLPIRLAPEEGGCNGGGDGSGGDGRGSGGDGRGSSDHRFFRPPAYQPPWFRCARPLTGSLFVTTLAAFWVAGDGSTLSQCGCGLSRGKAPRGSFGGV